MDELMKFLGLMWYMAVVQKGEYENYWGKQIEEDVFGREGTKFELILPLRRFKLLRQAFCFRKSSDITPEDLRRDSAVRIRTVLNMLKQMGGRYVNVGRNLAVHEVSIASRPKFGRHLIVYNPKKPTGKYHFNLYMCCCATSWIALSYRLHGESTLDDRTTSATLTGRVSRHTDSAYSQDENRALESEMSATAKTRQIVLDVTRAFYNTERIVNCDNYYTSVQLLEALRLKGLFCRGTVRRTSKHFPRHVILPDPDKAAKNANKSKNKRTTQADSDDDVEEELHALR